MSASPKRCSHSLRILKAVPADRQVLVRVASFRRYSAPPCSSVFLTIRFSWCSTQKSCHISVSGSPQHSFATIKMHSFWSGPASVMNRNNRMWSPSYEGVRSHVGVPTLDIWWKYNARVWMPRQDDGTAARSGMIVHVQASVPSSSSSAASAATRKSDRTCTTCAFKCLVAVQLVASPMMR